MINLNTEVATDRGTLVAVKTVKHGLEVYVIYLMGSATSLIEEVYSTLSERLVVTKLNQMIKL